MLYTGARLQGSKIHPLHVLIFMRVSTPRTQVAHLDIRHTPLNGVDFQGSRFVLTDHNDAAPVETVEYLGAIRKRPPSTAPP